MLADILVLNVSASRYLEGDYKQKISMARQESLRTVRTRPNGVGGSGEEQGVVGRPALQRVDGASKVDVFCRAISYTSGSTRRVTYLPRLFEH